jgi:hypothetical protein
MKFPAQDYRADPRPEPDYQVDPDVVWYFVGEIRRFIADPQRLAEIATSLNQDTTMYIAVHNELTFAEKTALKGLCHGR